MKQRNIRVTDYDLEVMSPRLRADFGELYAVTFQYFGTLQ